MKKLPWLYGSCKPVIIFYISIHKKVVVKKNQKALTGEKDLSLIHVAKDIKKLLLMQYNRQKCYNLAKNKSSLKGSN